MSGARALIQKLKENGLSKRILPKINLSSQTVNGAGAYVPAICKLVLFHNPPRPGSGGDSVGMVDYIHTKLPYLAKERPYVEIVVQKRNGPPEIQAYYNNGNVKNIVVKRWDKKQISEQLERVCDSFGQAPRKHFGTVLKGTASKLDQLKSHWDPFHAERIFRP